MGGRRGTNMFRLKPAEKKKLDAAQSLVVLSGSAPPIPPIPPKQSVKNAKKYKGSLSVRNQFKRPRKQKGKGYREQKEREMEIIADRRNQWEDYVRFSRHHERTNRYLTKPNKEEQFPLEAIFTNNNNMPGFRNVRDLYWEEAWDKRTLKRNAKNERKLRRAKAETNKKNVKHLGAVPKRGYDRQGRPLSESVFDERDYDIMRKQLAKQKEEAERILRFHSI